MPIYEYQCSLCEEKVEALQKISDEPLRECPVCLAPSLKKLVSAASFRLKGGGWYETDFKTGDKKKLAESDSSENKSGNSPKEMPKKSSEREKASASSGISSTKASEGGGTSTSGKNSEKI